MRVFCSGVLGVGGRAIDYSDKTVSGITELLAASLYDLAANLRLHLQR